MSKNQNDYTNYLFNLITNGNYDPAERKIYLSISEAVKANYLASFQDLSVVEVEYIQHDVKIVSFVCDGNKYLLMTNIKSHIEDGAHISEWLKQYSISVFDINVCMLTALVKDAKIKTKSGFLENRIAEDMVTLPEDPAYTGHEIEDLKNALEDFTVFEIDPESSFFDLPVSALGYYIYSSFSQFIHLPFGEKIRQVRDVFPQHTKIPKDNLFLFLTSTHWKHAYLEAYRCIESLYVIPRALQLKKALGVTIKAIDLAQHCASELGWRRKEEESLYKLMLTLTLEEINHTEVNKLSFLADVDFKLQPDSGWTLNKIIERLSNKIYMIRNQLVHHGVSEREKITLNENDWEILINFLMAMIIKVYSEFDGEIN